MIVVDNASADDTVPTVRERFPWATLIVNDDNLGYVGGNNVGIRYALEHGADYVFILNSDTKMTPTVLQELVRVMQRDPRIAIAGAKNLYMQNPAYTWGKYGVLNWGPMLVRTHGRFVRDYPEASPKDVDWVIGNGCMMSREALEKVGIFDEDFFQVNEDVDWCMRARKLGYRVVYVDTAAIHHKGASSADLSKPIVFSYGYFLGRNAILFARKHANPLQWALLLTNMALGVAHAHLVLLRRAPCCARSAASRTSSTACSTASPVACGATRSPSACRSRPTSRPTRRSSACCAGSARSASGMRAQIPDSKFQVPESVVLEFGTWNLESAVSFHVRARRSDPRGGPEGFAPTRTRRPSPNRCSRWTACPSCSATSSCCATSSAIREVRIVVGHHGDVIRRHFGDGGALRRADRLRHEPARRPRAALLRPPGGPAHRPPLLHDPRRRVLRRLEPRRAASTQLDRDALVDLRPHATASTRSRSARTTSSRCATG